MAIAKEKSDEEEIKEMLSKIALSIFPQIVVHLGLENEFENDKNSVIIKVLNYINDENQFSNDTLVSVVTDGYAKIDELLKHISSDNDLVKQFPEMFLFEIFSIFEGFINHYLYSEVVLNYDFSLNKINSILSKLSTTDKIDWFMEMVVGQSFITHSAWGEIKPFLKARNSLVHLKPMEYTKEDVIKEKVTCESLVFLMEQIKLLSEEISNTKSAEMEENEQKIENIRKKM
ncbi:hypothetical protein ACOMCU_10535 [Lysinibacillus sp. UGB7]|uniref:hypothetical protein n=1 Tax=Lysinibacillus sp. UGB7 TaxID=3411039 RepID=UPI003B8262C7